MRKLEVNQDMVVTNIVEDPNNLLHDTTETKYLRKFDEDAHVGDTVDYKGRIISRAVEKYQATAEEKAQHYRECIESGEYVVDEDNLLNASGVQLCPIVLAPKIN